MSSLISAIAWVRRGVSAQHPRTYVLDEQELARVSALARIEIKDARIELERVHEATKKIGKDGEEPDDHDDEADWVDEDADSAMDVDSSSKRKDDDLSQYKLDEYDEDTKADNIGPFSNIKGLTYYRNNDEDPYITFKEEDEDEREELEVLPTDNLIVTAKTEDDISQLEIYVYDESEVNLYVHHDLMLSNFPLCLEWLDFVPASPSQDSTARAGFGSYIAVGTLDPEIEIWSLDVVETMYPQSILGRPDQTRFHVPIPLGTGKKKRKKTKSRSLAKSYHVDAVLALAWNKVQRNFLASASADRTVKLWDLNRDPTINGDETDGSSGGAIRSFDIHKDKVQAVRWNEKEPSVLLTGSYDRTVRTFDSRSPDTGVGAVLGSDVEALQWDPWENHAFYVSLENGIVLNFDVRTLPSSLESPSPARFTVSAHDGAVCSIDINPHIKGCFATGGVDKMVKIWNVDEVEGKQSVTLVTSRDLGVGKIFSVAFSPDDPLALAAAGSKAKLQIWDVGSKAGVQKVFHTKLQEAGKRIREKETKSSGVIGVESDDEQSDESDTN